MSVSGITTPVPSSEDYQAPETTASRIAAKWGRMPRVDAHGFPVRTQAETGTTDVTGPDPIATVPATPPSVTPSGSHTPLPTPGGTGTLADRMREKAQLQLDQPIPPGSTTV